MDIRAQLEGKLTKDQKYTLIDRAKKLKLKSAARTNGDKEQRFVVEDPTNGQIYNFAYEEYLGKGKWIYKDVMKVTIVEGKPQLTYWSQPPDDVILLGIYLIEQHHMLRLKFGIYGQEIEYEDMQTK